MTSRPWEEVLDEARRLASMGYHEAVLTGVLIGAYGPETGSGGPVFEDLVQMLAERSGLARLRISSIEMRQVTPRLIDLAQSGAIVPHFHIPLQSGSTKVLGDMNRPYGQAEYLELCDRLYAALPDLSLTTDCLVGFPTESEADLQQSVHVFESARFLKAHIFPFSPRPGTPADAFGDPVPPQVKQERRARLISIAQRTGRNQSRHFVGRTMRVLIEGKSPRDGLLHGLTDNYLSVHAAGPAASARTLQWVRLDEERDGDLYGEIVSAPSPLRLAPMS